ncbi:MAG: ribosomal protein P0 (A0) (L10E) [Chaenotheca gracillima]|nr:MAG: ribosomal protein P0 (A0) (L10E) [Chaenotheca gracillima]
MQHPFQCLQIVTAVEGNLLLAAAGSRLHCFSLSDGSLVSSWGPGEGANSPLGIEEAPDSHTISPDFQTATESLVESEHAPPGKRRKLSPAEQSDVHVQERTVDSSVQDDATTISKSMLNKSSFILRLCTTQDGRYAVTATAEDKCIRVFAIEPHGQLHLLSERSLPKRPCALDLTAENSTIICGDKFGDVYSLPLFAPADTDGPVGVGSSSSEIKAYKSSADPTTVHTKRNHRALKYQLQRQSNKPGTANKRQELNWKPLLGHVSLLTDLITARLDGSGSDSATKGSFILTSDRDEHIRVSRGPPQSHVIEGFCLGHTEFVSRLCIPTWYQSLLVSGGGDGLLIVWHWKSSRILNRYDLHPLFADFLDKREPEMGMPAPGSVQNGEQSDSVQRDAQESESRTKLVVSGIWPMEITGAASSGPAQTGILVALEGTPALFVFFIDRTGSLRFHQTLLLRGNVLDVSILADTGSFLASVDNIYCPSSTEKFREPAEGLEIVLQSFKTFPDGVIPRWVETDISDSAPVTAINKLGSHELRDDDFQSLKDNLYSIEKLRKRGNEE